MASRNAVGKPVIYRKSSEIIGPWGLPQTPGRFAQVFDAQLLGGVLRLSQDFTTS